MGNGGRGGRPDWDHRFGSVVFPADAQVSRLRPAGQWPWIFRFARVASPDAERSAKADTARNTSEP